MNKTQTVFHIYFSQSIIEKEQVEAHSYFCLLPLYHPQTSQYYQQYQRYRKIISFSILP